MKMNLVLRLLLATVLCACARAQETGPPAANVERVPYDDNGFNLTGYVSMPDLEDGATVPAVIIIPDANGNDQYEQQRATMIAQEFGYVGFAADIYGSEFEDGVPDDMRFALLGRYRNDEPALYMSRIAAAVAKVKTFPEVNGKIGIIGYCFGGSGVLMFALDDNGVNDDVAAVVSFHGGLGDHVWNHRLNTAPADGSVLSDANETRPQVLVLSGGSDDMSTDIIFLEDTMDNATLEWEITRYSGIQHAFTVWGDDRYNELADQRSWSSMGQFLKEAFGDITFDGGKPSGVMVEGIEYVDETDGKELLGYLATPDESKWQLPAPAVVIIPDWDGVNTYEQERATILAEAGYVAFAADIYGADLQNDLDFDTRIAQSTLYRSERNDLYVSRMQRAVELVKTLDSVDSDNVAILGYCFGGTGVVQYAFSGRDDVKVITAYHGNVQEQFLPNTTIGIVPYTMILSGGEDDAHGDQNVLEQSLNDNSADWEISRYSGVFHGFTAWEAQAYNLNADVRSWTAMMTAFERFMPAPEPVGGGAGQETMVDGDDGQGTDSGKGALSPVAAFAAAIIISILLSS